MILRSIGIWLCEGIYESIPKMYSIFYNLANARFFTEDDTIIDELSSNIYVLVSVVMLFIFSATFLSAIINPDAINDKKKGIGALLKRAFIGIVLIVLIPFGFDEAYKVQNNVMENHLIEKILVGINYESDEDAQNGGNGGQVIAGTLIASVLYPSSDGVQVSKDFSGSYKAMVQEDINEIENVADYINESPVSGTSDEKYALHFDGLIAIIAGVGTLYILLLFAMDMAVRMFKLAFYELTAPISVVAYMAVGDDQLKRWLKEVGATLVDTYLRIAAMAFYIFLVSRLQTFLNQDQFDGATWKELLQVLLVVGMLIFVKQVPDVINNAFGTKFKPKGGIGGRLGQMAVVGDTAKKAWDKVTKVATNVAMAGAALATPIGFLGLGHAAALGAGLGLAHHGWNKGFFADKKHGARAGKDTMLGKGLTKVGKGLSYAGTALAGDNLIAGAKAAKKKYDESEEGKYKAYEKNLAAEKKLKTNTAAAIAAAGSSITGLKFGANNKLDLAATAAADANTTNFAKLVDSNGIRLSETQKTHIKSYNEKENKLMETNQTKATSSNLSQFISDSISAATGTAQKNELLALKDKLENQGNYTISSLSSDLSSFSPTSQTLTTIQNYLTQLDGKGSMNGTNTATGQVNFKYITAENNKAQEDYDRVSKRLDNTIENAGTAESKQMLKSLKGTSKTMNKHNTGTI